MPAQPPPTERSTPQPAADKTALPQPAGPVAGPGAETGPRPIYELMMEIVPLDVQFNMPQTDDGERINEMHRALYGRDSIYWSP